MPRSPIVFRRDSGSRAYDYVTTTYAILQLVSQRFIDVLREGGFTGWSTYPVEVYGKHGELIPGYHGLAITGRCGPIDDSMSELIWCEPVQPGKTKHYQRLLGLYFDPESWDGSDLFCPEGTARVIVRDVVKDALEAVKITNVDFTSITEELRSPPHALSQNAGFARPVVNTRRTAPLQSVKHLMASASVDSIFEVVSDALKDANVLVLFARNGALGLQSAANGAHYTMMVEDDDSLVTYLQEQITSRQYESKMTVLQRDPMSPRVLIYTPNPLHVIEADVPTKVTRDPRRVTCLMVQLQSFREQLVDRGVVILRTRGPIENAAVMDLPGFDRYQVRDEQSESIAHIYQKRPWTPAEK